MREVNLQIRIVGTGKHSICNSILLISIKTNQGLFILPETEIQISYGQRTIHCFTELTTVKKILPEQCSIDKERKINVETV